ncbi:type IX secretion system protein PorN/GldN [Pedobacter sp. ASV12]|uniref:type IX secretion system ring protein PorN/GldN n=1 Tax=Pedobacter sp. ASV12 TaxID=2795120 RepID=UPI0018ECF47B|nr:gliding motility protein GldN [Pedobacter sp. ASV12]
MRKVFFLSLLLLTTAFAFAQTTATPPPTTTTDKPATPKKKLPKKDGYVYREESVADTVVPYSVVNKEDVAYTKRVWREIDLRDHGNQILASPKINLIGVIYEALKNGELDMYANDDEDFQKDPINNKKANNAAGTYSAADTAFLGVNPGTNEVNRANNEFFAASYPIVRLKEDWILDIKRGIFEPRIIGLALVRIDVKTQVDNNGNPVVDPTTNTARADTLKSATGWFYFDDLREILVKKKIANNFNDNSGINFDDVFTRRLFFSNIVKQSNAADNRIEDYISNSKDRLLESERIKKAMADFEQGLWEY